MIRGITKRRYGIPLGRRLIRSRKDLSGGCSIKANEKCIAYKIDHKVRLSY